MKKGDKFVCIEDFYGHISDSVPLFYKNHIYIYRDVLYDPQKNTNRCFVLDSEDDLREFFYGDNYFNNYFVSLKTYRKLKLEKINESRR